MTEKYSVLMSVYYKEKAEYLQEAMQSIFDQTVTTDDFVLICDGPLNVELNKVISDMQSQFGKRLHVYRLENNIGLGNALNIGINYCKNELIARMDSDDVSKPNRCEKQLEYFSLHKECCLLSGGVEEFVGTIDNVVSRRILPCDHEKILKFSKQRNPMNHPCVMFRKSKVLYAGGYKDFYLLEDYYLWIRMLCNGAIAYNIKEPLLWMRVGKDLYCRRGGIPYAKSQIKLFKYMRDIKYISSIQFVCGVLVRTIAAMIPNRMRRIAYMMFLRKK